MQSFLLPLSRGVFGGLGLNGVFALPCLSFFHLGAKAGLLGSLNFQLGGLVFYSGSFRLGFAASSAISALSSTVMLWASGALWLMTVPSSFLARKT